MQGRERGREEGGEVQLAENLTEQQYFISYSCNPCPSRRAEGFHVCLNLLPNKGPSESAL